MPAPGAGMSWRPLTVEDAATVAAIAGADEAAFHGRPSRVQASDVEAWWERADLASSSWLYEEDGVPMAFGVTIPVETVCNLPGVGQLAWLAAQKRDLPVLTGMTLALLTLTLLCGAMARAASRATVGWAERDAA